MRRGLALIIVRSIALLVVLIGIAQLAIDAFGVMSYFNDPQKAFAHSVRDFLKSLNPSLALTTLGSVVFVLTRIKLSPVPLRRHPPAEPFDLKAAIGPYIEFETMGRRFRRRLSGVGLIVLAVVLGPVWGAVRNGVYRGVAPDREALWLAIVVMLVLSFPVVVVRMRCLMAGVRRCAPRAETMLRFKRGHPVLYLRSYVEDQVARPWEASSMFFGWFLGWLPETFERSLAKAVARVGPLVALGKPGERLAPLGGARLYVREHDDWQRVVADLVRGSQLVILRVGYTDSFWWEFEHLRANCDPRKVVVFLPPKDRFATYRYLRDRVRTFIPHPFPSTPGKAMFVAFGPDWEPRLLGASGPSLSARLRRLLAGSPAPAVREALNGALKPLGLNARRLPFQFREWFTFAVLPLAILFILS